MDAGIGSKSWTGQRPEQLLLASHVPYITGCTTSSESAELDMRVDIVAGR